MEGDAADLPAGSIGTPMTYLHEGKQYIALTIGGDVPEPGFPIWLWYLTARTSRRAVISGVPTQGTHHGG